jgi:hypothetical protein
MAELQAARKIIGAKLAYYAEWEKAGKRPAILPSALDP